MDTALSHTATALHLVAPHLHIATVLSRMGTAPSPMATVLSRVGTAPSPMATAPSLMATALSRTATAPSPMNTAPSPMATCLGLAALRLRMLMGPSLPGTALSQGAAAQRLLQRVCTFLGYPHSPCGSTSCRCTASCAVVFRMHGILPENRDRRQNLAENVQMCAGSPPTPASQPTSAPSGAPAPSLAAASPALSPSSAPQPASGGEACFSGKAHRACIRVVSHSFGNLDPQCVLK
jgi:hypothetical protein